MEKYIKRYNGSQAWLRLVVASKIICIPDSYNGITASRYGVENGSIPLLGTCYAREKMKVVLIIIVDAEEEFGYHTEQDVIEAIAEAIRNYDESLQVEISPLNE